LAAASDVPLHSLSFDEYSDRVIGATVNFLLTGPSQAPWSVGHCQLGSIVLQFGVEGGSKILHGISRPDVLSFVFQEQIADRLIFDGQILQPQDFVVLPPGSDFTIASCGIHRWMSITMPVGLFETFAVETGRKHLAWVEKEKCVISPPGQLLKCLTAVAASTAVLIREKQTSTPHGFCVARLLEALIAAIAGLNNELCLPTEKSRLSSHTVAKALKYARDQKWGGLQVAELALATDVTSRTLLRTFRQQLGVGPASYLKLRQLNMVRRALRGKCEPSGNVTNIMSEHGVTEFGRFASEYKALFGERPSETVARSRVQRARRSDAFQPA
jgi:AraC family transcriptional regulator, ethanolamine operon transcriptional activator